MNDRELEARLRTHLHRRFDDATPSPELIASVQQVLRTEPAGVGPRAVGLRPMPALSWSFVGAAALIAILVVAGIRFGNLISPGIQGSAVPASPTDAPVTERAFMVVPPSDNAATRTETLLAEAVLSARLRALGFETPTRTSGQGIGYLLPVDGATDTQIYHALVAIGEVAFVPLPAEDYGEGGAFTAEVGQALPKDEPALFSWDGIASVEQGTDQQDRPIVVVTLTPAAGAAFASYTEDHVGESFAVLIDGVVALLPVINEPITGGQLQVSGDSASEDYEETVAILVGGVLPESWRGAKVVAATPRERILENLLREFPGATAGSAELDVVVDGIRDGDRWRAVWRVEVVGEFRKCIPGPSGDPSCLTATRMEYVLDAESGDLVSSRSLDE